MIIHKHFFIFVRFQNIGSSSISRSIDNSSPEEGPAFGQVFPANSLDSNYLVKRESANGGILNPNFAANCEQDLSLADTTRL